jgi:hypothetical protein
MGLVFELSVVFFFFFFLVGGVEKAVSQSVKESFEIGYLVLDFRNQVRALGFS